MYLFIYVYICICLYLYLFISVYVHICSYLFISVSVYICICLYLYLFISVSVYIYLSFDVHICLYLFISVPNFSCIEIGGVPGSVAVAGEGVSAVDAEAVVLAGRRIAVVDVNFAAGAVESSGADAEVAARLGVAGRPVGASVHRALFQIDRVFAYFA